MSALGKQGLRVIRQAAQTAAALDAEFPPPIEQTAECIALAGLHPATLPHVGIIGVFEMPESSESSESSGESKPARKPRKRKPKTAAEPASSIPALPVFDREALRLKLEAASVRPMPGTSELLRRGLHTELAFGYTEGGKLTNDAESHDLTALAPIHLKRRE